MCADRVAQVESSYKKLLILEAGARFSKARTLSLGGLQPEKPSQIQIHTASQSFQEEAAALGADRSDGEALNVVTQGRRDPSREGRSKAPRRAGLS